MSDLTVVCAATAGVWERRARRALDSVLKYAPDVKTLLHVYKRAAHGTARMAGLMEPETPWILFMDADCLATGDVRELLSWTEHVPVEIAVRKSPLQTHPAWHQERYQDMLDDAGVTYRTVVWNGIFLAERELARQLASRWGYWWQWYEAYRPRIFDHRHRKWDQVSMTLALSEAGVYDEDTMWVDHETFSWHSRPGELGLIHHFNGRIYARLERGGRLLEAIEERRHARS